MLSILTNDSSFCFLSGKTNRVMQLRSSVNLNISVLQSHYHPPQTSAIQIQIAAAAARGYVIKLSIPRTEFPNAPPVKPPRMVDTSRRPILVILSSDSINRTV